MSAEELIALAAACMVCGEEHKPWQRPPKPDSAPYAPSYASQIDGHAYRPYLSRLTVEQLRGLLARVRELAS